MICLAELYSTGYILLADIEVKNLADLRDITNWSLITMRWKNAGKAQMIMISELSNRKGDSPK